MGEGACCEGSEAPYRTPLTGHESEEVGPMNEAQVNRTQADEAVVDGTQEDEAVADDMLDDDTQADGDGGDGLDMEKLRRLRLSGFLRELVRAEGRMEAAELLGVAYRTLVKAEESGQITGRVGDALERLLGTGDDPEAARLRERVGALEGGMEALAKELRGGLEEIRAAVAGRDEAQGQGAGQPQAQDREGAGRSETRAAPPVAGLRSEKRVRLPRLDPEVVTGEPADDDAEVYGEAWPLVEEWRSRRAGHPHQGRSLSWLTTEERLLTLELAMLEEHGLTLPPETQALRGFGRKGQINHRWKALADTRVALRKRKLLRWVRTVLTLWLWRK